MGDAVRDGDVRVADPEDTIDAIDRAAEPALSPVAAPPPRDYSQLTTVDRRHYLVVGELAKGGMGRVLEARDLRLGRAVAIKELLPKNRDAARRFEREARITARLQHPAIIHVYEAGVWAGGEPFYAMPKVAGRSLDKVVAEKKTLAERLGLLPNVIAVADALAYAHNENVIHRDLKPANVLVGEFGETVVIDWGLAKDLGVPSDPKESLQLQLRANAEETVTGSIVGTPAYMPPEQARGQAVDQRADVYALGALLYKLLSGDAPYLGDSSEDVIEQVKARPPTPIQQLVPDAPTELVAIVGKAMARDPDDRYITASAVAQDLKRFETGQLVGAHRYTLRQLVERWLRRYRLAVGVGVAALVAVIAIGVISVNGIVKAKRHAERERSNAQAGRVQLLEEHGRDELLGGRAGAALAYFAGAAEDGRRGGARGFLIADAMRPFDAEVAHIAVGTNKGNVALAVSEDGNQLVTGGDGEVAIAAPHSGLRLHTLAGQGITRVLAFDAAGRQIIAGGEDGIARVWRSDGTRVRDLAGHSGPINAVAFTRDGSHALTGGEDGTLRIWDLATGDSNVVRCHSAPIVSLELSPQEDSVLTASADTTACIVNARTGIIDRQLKGHRARLNGASWSPDGRLVITVSDDSTARIWSAERGKLVVAPLTHYEGSVNVGLLLGDGRVITAGTDRDIHLWRLPTELPLDGMPGTARALKALTGHTGMVVSAALSTDESALVTGGFDGLVKVWDLDTLQATATFEHADVVTSVRFVPGKPLVATGSRDGAVRVWKTATAKVRHELDSVVHALAVSPDHTVAAGTDDSHVTLVTPSNTSVLDGQLGRVLALAFSPDGKWLVSGGEDEVGAATLWDVATSTKIATLPIAGPVRALAFTRDGALVALTGDHVEMWSVASRARTARLESTVQRLDALAVSSVGGEIAAVGGDGTVVLWTADGTKLAEAKDRSTPYNAVVFAPDGRSLVTAGPGLAHVWLVDSGKLATKPFPLDGPTGLVHAVAVTADGSCVVTASDDGRADIWDIKKGKLLGSRGPEAHALTAIAVDGETLWAAGEDGTVVAWDMRVDAGSITEIVAFMHAKHIAEHLDADNVVRGTR